MSKIVFVGGNKGGSAKTTNSHLLCAGLALRGYQTALITTDNRNIPSGYKRPFSILDGRTPEKLDQIINGIRQLDGDKIFVIDGAASRDNEFDGSLAGRVDLFVVPFTDNREDMDLALLYCRKHDGARALPSNWPTNVKEKITAEALINQMRTAVGAGRVMNPVSRVSGSKVFAEDEIEAAHISTRTRNVARELATQVLELLELE